MGAKNHAVIMPDADVDTVASALAGAAFGAAGQRCMAISAAVFVGGMERYRDALVQKARSLKVGGRWAASREGGRSASRGGAQEAHSFTARSTRPVQLDSGRAPERLRMG